MYAQVTPANTEVIGTQASSRAKQQAWTITDSNYTKTKVTQVANLASEYIVLHIRTLHVCNDLITVDCKIFAVKNISSVTFSNEN